MVIEIVIKKGCREIINCRSSNIEKKGKEVGYLKTKYRLYKKVSNNYFSIQLIVIQIEKNKKDPLGLFYLRVIIV